MNDESSWTEGEITVVGSLHQLTDPPERNKREKKKPFPFGFCLPIEASPSKDEEASG